jgi:hypothetical protein
VSLVSLPVIRRLVKGLTVTVKLSGSCGVFELCAGYQSVSASTHFYLIDPLSGERAPQSCVYCRVGTPVFSLSIRM